MAKIAVVFLLFAIVAVCNGARLRREEPTAPKVGIDFQPILEEIKKLGSDQNLQGLKEKVDSFNTQVQAGGAEAWGKLKAFGEDVLEALQKQLNEQPKKA